MDYPSQTAGQNTHPFVACVLMFWFLRKKNTQVSMFCLGLEYIAKHEKHRLVKQYTDGHRLAHTVPWFCCIWVRVCVDQLVRQTQIESSFVVPSFRRREHQLCVCAPKARKEIVECVCG
jgi:hypothetical protein